MFGNDDKDFKNINGGSDVTVMLSIIMVNTSIDIGNDNHYSNGEKGNNDDEDDENYKSDTKITYET